MRSKRHVLATVAVVLCKNLQRVPFIVRGRKRTSMTLQRKYLACELVPENGACQEISLCSSPRHRLIGVRLKQPGIVFVFPSLNRPLSHSVNIADIRQDYMMHSRVRDFWFDNSFPRALQFYNPHLLKDLPSWHNHSPRELSESHVYLRNMTRSTTSSGVFYSGAAQ